MEVGSVLVTGANRGIGLEFVRQLVKLPKPPHFVFATYRNEATVGALKGLQDETENTKMVLLKVDVTQRADVRTARKTIEATVGEKGLNLLINNAGVANDQAFLDITEENMMFHFNTNCIGPVVVLQEMLPILKKAAQHQSHGGMSASRSAVLNISSALGSLEKVGKEFNDFLNATGYRISKAALNMAMRIAAVKVKDSGVLVVNICPGWVKTDMGTDEAQLEVSDSIATMLQTLKTLNESHHGTYIYSNGDMIPF